VKCLSSKGEKENLISRSSHDEGVGEPEAGQTGIRKLPRGLAALGLVTGAVAGLYWDAQDYWTARAVPDNPTTIGLLAAMLGGLILTGLFAACVFLLAHLRRLFQPGRGPFFWRVSVANTYKATLAKAEQLYPYPVFRRQRGDR
jgi:hypothetical protein